PRPRTRLPPGNGRGASAAAQYILPATPPIQIIAGQDLPPIAPGNLKYCLISVSCSFGTKNAWLLGRPLALI
ncbi:MAG: hypothetical protein PVI27_10830, partial [Desulfobacteraceae bacterium]